MFNWPSHCPQFFDWNIYSFPVLSCHFYRSWQQCGEAKRAGWFKRKTEWEFDWRKLIGWVAAGGGRANTNRVCNSSSVSVFLLGLRSRQVVGWLDHLVEQIFIQQNLIIFLPGFTIFDLILLHSKSLILGYRSIWLDGIIWWENNRT